MPTQESVPASRLSRLTIVGCFLGSFAMLFAYWAKYIAIQYFPSGDEFALLVNSAQAFHPHAASWFREGFSHYFVPYPEWTAPYTNFLRPVVNITYWINSVIFGSHWGSYLLFTYAVQSGLVAISLWIASRQLGLSKRSAIMAGILCFASPAFGTEALFFPGFAFDLLAAFFVLLGIKHFLQRKLISAWLLFFLGVFTKETALFAPFLAAVLLVSDRSPSGRQRFLQASSFILPIMIWESMRFVAFRGSSGLYVFRDTSLHALAVQLVRGLASWPMGTRNPLQLLFIRNVFAVINLSFWLIVALLILYACFSRKIQDRDTARRFQVLSDFGLMSELRFEVAIFCAGGLAMPLLLNLPQRFGAVFYIMFFLTLLCMIDASPRPAYRFLATFAIILCISAGIFERIYAPSDLSEERRNWKLSASYINHLAASRASTVFVFNDIAGGYSSPEFVSRFAGHKGRLIVLDDFQPTFERCGLSDESQVSEPKSGQISIVSVLEPACGTYAFYGANPPVRSSAAGNVLDRNSTDGQISYLLPDIAPTPPSGVPSLYGRLTLQMRATPEGSVLLFPDLENDEFRELKIGPAKGPAEGDQSMP